MNRLYSDIIVSYINCICQSLIGQSPFELISFLDFVKRCNYISNINPRNKEEVPAMKIERNQFVSFFVPALIFAVLIGVFPQSAAALEQPDQASLEALRQKAWSEGSVMVIAHFRVPSIKRLTALSAEFKTADASEAVTVERMNADEALQRAIDLAAWKIVTELQGTVFEEIARFEYIPFIALRVSPEALAVLESSPDIIALEENGVQKLIDPVADAEKTSKGTAGQEEISEPMLDDTAVLVGAKALWDIGITGSGWYVAILDTGIRKTHQFFTGKNVIEACRALGRDGSSGAGDCPNGQAVQNGAGSAVHYPGTYDGYDHGTHVAGIAAGNYGSLAGMAKGANILAVKVFSKFSASDCGGSLCVMSWDSDQVAGLNYIYSLRGSYNIAAANMSLGGGRHASFCDSSSQKAAIDLLRAAGIATCIATGNDGYCGEIGSPGCISTSVSVGSTTKTDGESSFNNWDNITQRLFAPGSSIYSSTGDSDTSYASWNGTSMATPHVCGAWALIKQAVPTGTVTEILNALRTTGKAIYSSCDGYSTAIPRIKIFDAVSYLSAYTLTIQTSNISQGTTNPVPGVHGYPLNTSVSVTAVPKTYATFYNWTGDASGTANPVTVVINRNKTIRANFKYIFAPAAEGERALNRSFSQAEYINILTWTPDSRNAPLTITAYRIYAMNGDTPELLDEVDAGATEYWHRDAGSEERTYRIAAVASGGREGAPATVTIAAAE
jgi:subtilisin family serine protease